MTTNRSYDICAQRFGLQGRWGYALSQVMLVSSGFRKQLKGARSSEQSPTELCCWKTASVCTVRSNIPLSFLVHRRPELLGNMCAEHVSLFLLRGTFDSENLSRSRFRSFFTWCERWCQDPTHRVPPVWGKLSQRVDTHAGYLYPYGFKLSTKSGSSNRDVLFVGPEL